LANLSSKVVLARERLVVLKSAEVGVIKKLLDNYLTIVKKTIADSVPKAAARIACRNAGSSTHSQAVVSLVVARHFCLLAQERQ
jgi:hypothetical protein